MVIRIRLLLVLVVVIGVSASTLRAQEPEATPPRAKEARPKKTQVPNLPAATVEKIMEQAVANIALRYNLNEAQKQKTDALMKREVRRFLREHENEVWPVIRELLTTQFGAKPPDDPEDVKRIGRAAGPLARLARKAIIDANAEWREYLTPEQKDTHDFDMAEMNKTFDTIDRNFEQWAAGKAPVGGIFPPQPAPNAGPRTPRKPVEGLPEPEVITFEEGIFDTFVMEFIRDNDLDEGQIDSARSILKEFKIKAHGFRIANRSLLQKVAHDLKTAVEAHDRELSRKAEADRKVVLRPVYELFAEMDERLRALLTSAQLERYKQRKQAPTVGKQASSKVPKASEKHRKADRGEAGDQSRPSKPDSDSTAGGERKDGGSD